MDKQRRNFLKIAGVTALAGIGAPAFVRLSSASALASEQGAAEGHAAEAVHGAPVEAAPQGVRLGMVIDMRKITEQPELLDKAIAACIDAHNIPQFDNRKSEIKWLWKAPFANVFPVESSYHLAKDVKETDFAVLCNHCDNPPCVRACPTKATFRVKANGIVAMDFHRCIGCRFCMAACPYGARSFNWEDPRPYIKKYNKDFPSRMRGVVEKCNFCGERLALGQEPACVEACQGTGAIVFGDLNDAQSEIRQLLDKEFTIQRNAALGTKPSVFYIV
ncbi:MAG: 4Fe-4S dicluster domain-containing protein [Proteobacteria bacterium]|jgi:molybdopterin-containing oxidoreductase family iron-sulfur binding subunit|nr:4Fe-4S dicluster domain-containing protein [Desulfocapsa sp.]MBU3946488.1 4Fe-4S dicluster domain-containing protein [Pseudomonadota bacterium]MCG2743025.1 4Fe-4S dicluster domain-containing protein [Desulfobacteraceae bacterium]MDO8946443.1 4Fe-4S dicluster domain-containing protein [Desulfocapsaceae bacterium]MBU3984006.1 4Fe-4S dicluster domain-containing protein [Pseudomonadota bacterium]